MKLFCYLLVYILFVVNGLSQSKFEKFHDEIFLENDVNKIFLMDGELLFATEKGLFVRDALKKFHIYKNLHDEVHDVVSFKGAHYILEQREIYLDKGKDSPLVKVDSVEKGVILAGAVVDSLLYVLVSQNDEGVVFCYHLATDGSGKILSHEKYFDDGYRIWDLHTDKNHNIWIASDGGIYVVEYNKGKQTPAKLLSSFPAYCITERGDWLYFGSKGKLYRHDLAHTNKNFQLIEEPLCPELSKKRLSHLTVGDDGKVIFSSSDYGTWGMIDIPTTSLRLENLSIGVDNINTIFFDEQTKQVYIGTEGHGIFECSTSDLRREINCEKEKQKQENAVQLTEGTQKVLHYLPESEYFSFECESDLSKNQVVITEGQNGVGMVLFDSKRHKNNRNKIRIDSCFVIVSIIPLNSEAKNIPCSYKIVCQKDTTDDVPEPCSNKTKEVNRDTKKVKRKHTLSSNHFSLWINAHEVADKVVIYNGDDKNDIIFDSVKLKGEKGIDDKGYISGVCEICAKTIYTAKQNIITIEISTGAKNASTHFDYKIICER